MGVKKYDVNPMKAQAKAFYFPLRDERKASGKIDLRSPPTVKRSSSKI